MDFLFTLVDVDRDLNLLVTSDDRVKQTVICATGLKKLDVMAPASFLGGEIGVLFFDSGSWCKNIRVEARFDLDQRICGKKHDIVFAHKDFNSLYDQIEDGEPDFVGMLRSSKPLPDSEQKDKALAEKRKGNDLLDKARQNEINDAIIEARMEKARIAKKREEEA